ncbi:MAG TPA: hypothetical protein VNT55_06365 [Baekduia sp.]|nr:hypothetical protein [Baekduia sp.]
MSMVCSRGTVAVLAGLALAGTAPAANAAQATLWGCHGPAGQPLGTAPFSASASGDGGAETFAGGCGTAAGALDDGGLRAAFTRADPSAASAARWQAELPAGLAVSQVELLRRTGGFGGTPVPDGAQRYVAETAAGLLEASSVEDATNAPLDGVAAFPTTGRSYVRFGLSCGSTSSGRCTAPSATPLSVDVGAVAVTVSDPDPPRGAVGGVSSPASGTLMLNVRATDAGIGLASAQASVDGVVVAATGLGGPGCGDLSPADPAIDLPLGGGCPSTVEDLRLPVPTTAFGDGAHRLQVSVTDAAGNRSVLVDQPFTINNTPPGGQSSALLTLGTGESTASPSGPGAGGGGTESVAGAGSTASGSRAACLAPRLSMFLKNKSLRVVKGVPVLRRNGRYRYSGTLTCAVGGRRVHAHSGVVVSLSNQIGRRTYRKRGVVTRSDGSLAVVLAYPSSRLLDFRYTSADGTTTRVRIRITVTRKKAS